MKRTFLVYVDRKLVTTIDVSTDYNPLKAAQHAAFSLFKTTQLTLKEIKHGY